MKTSNQIRQAFLDFWTSNPRNAKVVPNASIVPNNDPTLLFVNSGMFPLVPYLGGLPHPLGKRLCNVQKCIRTNDIDEVGDYNHLTFFEMIGNWSLGDFTKASQIPWKLELYVKHFGLDIEKLYVSVWGGNDVVPRDDEAIEIWKKAFREYGIEAEFSEDITNVPQIGEKSSKDWKYRIFPFGKKSNWWQRGADTEGELGGPTSELFYDMGDVIYVTNEKLNINDDSGRYLEVGNSVFMEYRFGNDGSWHLMEQKNIDFGGGLDRIVAVVQNKRSIYETDLFSDSISKIEELSGKKYEEGEQISEDNKSFRIIAEHSRSSTILLGDGVMPGNKDQGYILRRLIRRMIRHGLKLGIENNFTKQLCECSINKLKDSYPYLLENKSELIKAVELEEEKFRKTIKNGIKEFYKILEDIKKSETPRRNFLTGVEAFYLYETYGFPIELISELASEIGFVVATYEFELEFKKHKENSRSGSSQKFKGGMADQSTETTKLHTLHHVLLASLQKLINSEIKQKGSNITAERLRLDFNLDKKLTEDEILKIEELVNDTIKKDMKVFRFSMKKDEAIQIGAQMEFGQNYPDIVTVYMISSMDDAVSNKLFGKSLEKFISDLEEKGNVLDLDSAKVFVENSFSVEFCGGPHVNNTSEIYSNNRKFKIFKQENIGAGLKRIKAGLVN